MMSELMADVANLPVEMQAEAKKEVEVLLEMLQNIS